MFEYGACPSSGRPSLRCGNPRAIIADPPRLVSVSASLGWRRRSVPLDERDRGVEGPFRQERTSPVVAPSPPDAFSLAWRSHAEVGLRSLFETSCPLSPRTRAPRSVRFTSVPSGRLVAAVARTSLLLELGLGETEPAEKVVPFELGIGVTAARTHAWRTRTSRRGRAA